MKSNPLILLFLALLAFGNAVAQVRIANPTVEMQDGSQPLATDQPRFSWNYVTDTTLYRYGNTFDERQTSYRIIVASTEENARNKKGDLWDSGTIPSDQMLYIPYGGQPLHSRDKAYWKVITSITYKDTGMVKHYRDGEYVQTTMEPVTRIAFNESDVNSFEISLLNQDDWSAKWIGYDYDDDTLIQKTRLAARYLRKEFTLKKKVREARLYVCGLGQYSIGLNGRTIGEKDWFKPALSDYRKRVYFNAYDVTDLLRAGKGNAIGITLAGGRYMTMRYNKEEEEWGGLTHIMHFGAPRMILQLEITYKDGTQERIISDESWHITNRGPIRTSNEFDGETYDENYALGKWLEPNYDDSSWEKAELVDAPGGQLVPQPNPNIACQELVMPERIYQRGDKWMVDMGQNMVGAFAIQANGMQSGDTITLRFAETLNPDGLLFVDNLRAAEATDRYVIHNSEFTIHNVAWKPEFVYHGFRYVEISGLREAPDLNYTFGLVLYDRMGTTGHFECSDEIINKVYHNAYWGIRGNYRSMPTDCPQRDERMGWTGDHTTGCYGESYIFDNHLLYSKWLADIEDSQWENGSLSDVCPAYWRRYTDNMTWPGAFITVADMLYTRYGDIEGIRKHYPAMKRWIEHMANTYGEDGIITRDCYGDWCVPPESPELIHSKDILRNTYGAAISTPFYCYLCQIMARFADLLDLPEDAEQFRFDANFSANAYNGLNFDAGTANYENGSVTANILPLAFGMVPTTWEKYVFDNIVNKTENDFGGHVSCGVVGIQQLMRTLTDYGRGDLALKLATNDTYPSWGYMVRNGATTIWELWNGNTADPSMNSGNHVMLLGDLILWEYEYLAGIRALEPGYRRIQLKPYPIEGLDYVNCTYKSVSGDIQSSWKRDGDQFEWEIVIPANTTAEVWLPTANGYDVKTYGSGRWRLTSTLR